MRKTFAIATLSASAALLLGSVGLASAREANSGRDDRPAREVEVRDSATSTTVDDQGVDDPASHDIGDDQGVDDPATHDAGDDHGVDAPAAADSTVTTVDDHVSSERRGRDHAEDDSVSSTTVDDSTSATTIDDHGDDSGTDGVDDGPSHDLGDDHGGDHSGPGGPDDSGSHGDRG